MAAPWSSPKCVSGAKPAAPSAAWRTTDAPDSSSRGVARSVSLAEIARQFRLADREQALTGLTRDGLLDCVGPEVAAPAVRPGLASAHHLRTQIVAIEPDARQSPAVNIAAPDRHQHTLVQRTLHQHRTRGLTTGLADLGRIDAVNAQLARRATGVWLHPKRIAIRDIRNFSSKCPCRMGIV